MKWAVGWAITVSRAGGKTKLDSAIGSKCAITEIDRVWVSSPRGPTLTLTDVTC